MSADAVTTTAEAPAIVPPAVDSKDEVNRIQSLPFILVHFWAIWAVFHTGFHTRLVLWGLASYYLRMVFVTMGYHRYFSHRSFKTSRVFQFILAFAAETTLQKGVLWWASHHRHHHKYSDLPEDVHSPLQRGFWYSHIGWILSDKWMEVDEDKIKDFSKYPELRFLDNHFLVPPLSVGALIWIFAGYDAFLWAGIVATAVLWHGTFTINSLAHVFGSRPYKTTDTSRNNFFLALITCGEGWHNNHHFYQSTANQGWHWWQIDISYYVIKALQAVGLVWDVRTPPQHIVESEGEEPLVQKIKDAVGNSLPVLPSASSALEAGADSTVG